MVSSGELTVFRPDGGSAMLQISGCIVVIWLLWRFWTFGVLPLMRKNDPKVLPYWTPGIGHTLSYLKNSRALFAYAKKHYRDNREPYAIQLATKKIYVLTNPEDMTAAYSNMSSLSFAEFLKAMLEVLGLSTDDLIQLYKPITPKTKSFASKSRIHMVRRVHDLQYHHLKGERLDVLVEKFQTYFEKTLMLGQIRSRRRYVKSNSIGSIDLDLMLWCEDFLTNAGQESYFGTRLAEIDPDMSHTFTIFNESIWQLFYKYPKLFSRKVHRAKDNMLATLKKFLEEPAERRHDSSWFVKTAEAEMREHGLSSVGMSRIILLAYFGANTNMAKVSFWMFAHMLFNPELISVVREETAPAFASRDLDGRSLEACPRFDGIWCEALRLYSSAVSTRYTLDDTAIGGKTLRKGNFVIMMSRQIHLDSKTFGDRVSEFDSKRFIVNKTLRRSSDFKPFGGGATLCPGQTLAKRGILAFVALVLHRFDIGLAEPQTFPRADENSPAIGGIIRPVPTDRLIVKLSPRHPVNSGNGSGTGNAE